MQFARHNPDQYCIRHATTLHEIQDVGWKRGKKLWLRYMVRSFLSQQIKQLLSQCIDRITETKIVYHFHGNLVCHLYTHMITY